MLRLKALSDHRLMNSACIYYGINNGPIIVVPSSSDVCRTGTLRNAPATSSFFAFGSHANCWQHNHTGTRVFGRAKGIKEEAKKVEDDLPAAGPNTWSVDGREEVASPSMAPFLFWPFASSSSSSSPTVVIMQLFQP